MAQESCAIILPQFIAVCVIALRVLDLCYVCLYFLLLFFSSRCLQDYQANLHQIFQEDGKWAAIEKLCFWYLNSFRGEREVQKGHSFRGERGSKMGSKRSLFQRWERFKKVTLSEVREVQKGHSFRGEREVRKGHFDFGCSFTKCTGGAKRIYLSSKSCQILAGKFFYFTKRWKLCKNLLGDGGDSLMYLVQI